MIAVKQIGYDHISRGQNLQDHFISLPGIKLVLDGCGSCKYSEAGVLLFAKMFEKCFVDVQAFSGGTAKINPENFETYVDLIFRKLVALGESVVPVHDHEAERKFLRDYLNFTIVACFEQDTEWVVMSCGDGYVLLRTKDDLMIENLDPGSNSSVGESACATTYWAYNYCLQPATLISEYGGAVRFTKRYYDKATYGCVGVATDGFRYVENFSATDRKVFLTALYLNRADVTRRYLQHGVIKIDPEDQDWKPVLLDDLAIVF